MTVEEDWEWCVCAVYVVVVVCMWCICGGVSVVNGLCFALYMCPPPA
jgi:hypothetical protein